MTSPHERLDSAMEARRVELGLEWQEVAATAKVSPATLRSVRNGTTNPSALTKKRTEDALQWQRGSIDRILDGGAPTPLEDQQHTERPTVDQLEARVAAMEDEIAELRALLLRDREQQKRPNTG